MGKSPSYFIVESSALPEIFLKVAEAKRLLETGEVDTVHLATRRVGISRSAFYKYKDAVRPFNDMLHGRIVTFQFLLKDEPGVLSAVLNTLCPDGWEYSHYQPVHTKQRLCCGDGGGGDLGAAHRAGGVIEPGPGDRGSPAL